MFRRGPFLLIAFILISAAPPQTAEDWERRGNAAFADENYAEAARCYAHAQERGMEPGRIAFNHAAAMFRMGKYRDAERLARWAVEGAAPPDRRAKAVYNLGTCLLQSSDGKDGRRLAEAVGCFTRCLKVPGLSEMPHRRRTISNWRKYYGGQCAAGRSRAGGETAHGDEDRPPDKPPETTGQRPGFAAGHAGSAVGRTTGAGIGQSRRRCRTSCTPSGQMSPIPSDQQMQPLLPARPRTALAGINREPRAQRAGSEQRTYQIGEIPISRFSVKGESSLS